MAAAFQTGTTAYFFAGNVYLRVTRGESGPGTIDPGYPKPISDWGWGDFGKQGIDAIFQHGSKAYIFSGDKYLRVRRGEKGAGAVDPGYPKPISDWGWGDFGVQGIDAAFQSEGKAYFFSGGRYLRVTRGETGCGAVDVGYPKPLSDWGWGEFGKYGIDTAFQVGSCAYVFAGSQYIRLTRQETGAGTIDPGYPQALSRWEWPLEFAHKWLEYYPHEPKVILTLAKEIALAPLTRILNFRDHAGMTKSLKISFEKKAPLVWESKAFPEGLDPLLSLVDPDHRRYWDNISIENRGGSSTLHIAHLKIIMRYDSAITGLSPSPLNNAEISIVDWPIGMKLLAGNDEIDLNVFAQRSRYQWAGIKEADPSVIRLVACDLGKSGSDGLGKDQFGSNPKYGGGRSYLCSEFVSWYYYQQNIKINGKNVRESLRDIRATEELHKFFKAEGRLYRYNSGTDLQAFVHSETGVVYTPKPGDYLERRGVKGAEHSMLIYRWLPGNPAATNKHDRLNQAIVFNGPWPVTLRLIRIHESEVGSAKDFWLGSVD